MPTETDPPPNLSDGPLYWLAVLRSARTSGDALLESDARKRLAALGVRVVFDDRTDAPPTKGGGRA
jgi:hypothetical protein